MHSRLLAPLVALVIWSFVMCIWLCATRVPAIQKLKIAYGPKRPSEDFHAQLPPEVRWKADNYNNLMEQPALFHAIALTLTFLGKDTGLNLTLAWLYVGLRVVHSLIQVTINVVTIRFAVFMAASVVLGVLTVNAALAVF
jgi:hypothetical protein